MAKVQSIPHKATQSKPDHPKMNTTDREAPFFNFSELPLEVRLMIYELLILPWVFKRSATIKFYSFTYYRTRTSPRDVDGKHLVITRRGKRLYQDSAPSEIRARITLMRVNPQIHDEFANFFVCPVYVKNSNLVDGPQVKRRGQDMKRSKNGKVLESSCSRRP
jgi:hypothetical protein